MRLKHFLPVIFALLFAATFGPTLVARGAFMARYSGGGGGGGSPTATPTPTPTLDGTPATNQAASGALTLNFPTGVHQGSWVYDFFVGFTTSQTPPIAPKGWMLLGAASVANGNGGLYVRQYQTGDSAPSFASSGGSCGISAAFTGTNGNTNQYGNPISGLAPTSLTTVAPNGDLVLLGTWWTTNNVISRTAVATGFTSIATVASTASAYGCDFEYKLQTTAGAISTTGITLSATPATGDASMLYAGEP